MASKAEAWINLVLRRGSELRHAGVLSIGVDDNSAVFSPVQPGEGETADVQEEPPEPDGPRNSWEDPASYPTGIVPGYDIDPADKLPEIPDFGDA